MSKNKIMFLDKSKKLKTQEFDYDELNERMFNYFSSVKGLLEKEETIFQTSNIVGEYAEIIVCTLFGLIKQRPSQDFYDAISNDGLETKYQIKSRWKKSFFNSTGQKEFGRISKTTIVEKKAEYLILVFFKDTFKDFKIYKINLFNDFDKIKNNNKIVTEINKKGTEETIAYKIFYNENELSQFEVPINKKELTLVK